MKIAVVFPYNNPCSQINTRPVVLAGLPYVTYSKWKKDIIIFTSYTETPIEFNNLVIIDKIYNSKKKYNKMVIEQLKQLQITRVEIHQDCILASEIKKSIPTIKVALIKHGEYLINRFQEQFSLLRKIFYFRYIKHIAEIYCISDFVHNSLTALYPKIKDRIFTMYNTYGHISPFLANKDVVEKKSQIIFVGKPLAYKGIEEFLDSLPMLLSKYPTWTAIVVGAFFSSKSKYVLYFQKLLKKPEIQKLILENKLTIMNNLSSQEVFHIMQESTISVIPTKTQEPFGLVAVESHLAKCAVISSGNGGLKEISGQHASYLDSVGKENIFNAISLLIENTTKTKMLALLGYNNCLIKFSPQKLVRLLDDKRQNNA